jgi:hypothetical protein
MALTEDAPESKRGIAYVTPRLRAQMKVRGVDWTTSALQRTIKGKWVEVTGWLLFNTPFIKKAENTNPGNKSNWRATCWEIHPVTDIKILSGPPPT